MIIGTTLIIITFLCCQCFKSLEITRDYWKLLEITDTNINNTNINNMHPLEEIHTQGM